MQISTSKQRRVEPTGPINAKIMIIGEAPGHEEEREGLPFVGTSGRLLTQCLAKAGLNRQDIYITNVVKIKPPNNKMERLHELGITPEDYKEELLEEIKKVNPNVIVPLGNLAMSIICGASYKSITKIRGSILEIDGRKVIPTVHPAICLRQYEFTHLLTYDLKRIKEQSDFPELRRKQRTLKYGMDRFEDYLVELDMLQEEAEYLSVDLETFRSSGVIRCVGLGHRDDYALAVPILNKSQSIWSPAEEDILWRKIRQLLLTKKVIAQNANFEMTQLAQYTDGNMLVWMDTMRAHALLYPEFPHGLDFLGSVYTDIPYWKEDGKTSNDSDDSQLWEYNCKDVCATFEIAMELWEELKEAEMEEFYWAYDNPLMMSLWRMEQRGMKVDMTLLAEVREDLTERVDKLTGEITELAGFPLNVNSTKQMGTYLYQTLKLPTQYNRKTGRITSNADAIEKLSKKYNFPILAKVVELRNYKKLISTYVDIKMEDDNRMRTNYGLTETGRLTSRKNIFGSGMNMQNIPKSSRKIFVPDDGKILIAGDLAQAEAMVVAWISKDENLKNVFKEGGDIHSKVASLIFNANPPSPEQRTIAKRVVHGTNYCMGVNTLAGFCAVPVKVAKKVQEEYFKLFPLVRQWQIDIEQQIKKTRRLITPMGRKRTFFGRYGDQTTREAVAYVPQSTVADYINCALIRLDEALPIGADILVQVHDELVIQCDEGQLHEVMKTMKKIIQRPILCGADMLEIPLDLQTGYNWYEMEEVL